MIVCKKKVLNTHPRLKNQIAYRYAMLLILLSATFISSIVTCNTALLKTNQNHEIKIAVFPGIYNSNCYVVSRNGEGFIIDAGPVDFSIKKYLDEQRVDIKYIICTHSHIDHVLFVMELKNYTGAAIVLHKDDAEHYKYYTPERISEWIKNGEMNQNDMPYVEKFRTIKYDSLITGSEHFSAGGMNLEVIHTPGHSKGSVCLLIDKKYLFTGDTFFDEHVGNTDIDTGNEDDIKKSIKEKILPLSDSCAVYQGHGSSHLMKEIRGKLTS